MNSHLHACGERERERAFMVIILHYTHVSFELHMTCKYAHQKDTCYDGIGLCSHEINTILSAIINIIGRAYIYDHLKRKRILTLSSYKFFIVTPIVRFETIIYVKLHYLVERVDPQLTTVIDQSWRFVPTPFVRPNYDWPKWSYFVLKTACN